MIEAALRVAERDGVAAITHRAVAQEAGVASTAGTYHFPTVRRPPRRCCKNTCLSDAYRLSPSTSCTCWQLDDPTCGPPHICGWKVLAQWTDDETAIRAALAACGGLLIQGLIADELPMAEEIAGTMSYVLNVDPGPTT